MATSPDADPEDAGPELTAALETAEEAFTFAEADGDSIVLKGPAHPDNTFADPTEPYFWTPDNGPALNAWAIDLSAGSDVVTLTLDDGQVVTMQPVAATFAGVAGSFSAALSKRPPLALGDFETAGLEIDALGLIEAGAPPAVYGTAPRPASGALLDGELGIGPTNDPITRMRFRGSGNSAGGERITLNTSGSLVQRDYWSAGNAGNDLTLHLQTADGHISFPVAETLGPVGMSYATFNVPAAHQTFVAGIAVGERLLFAFTRAATAVATKPIAATFAGAAGSVSLALAKRSLATKPIAATFAAPAATLGVSLAKRAPGTQPIAATFAGALGSLSLALAKRSLTTKPIAATFAARAGSLAAALSKSARLTESARRRIRSTSGSWDGVRVGDLVAVGRATSYTRDVEVAAVRDVEVAAVRHDDRNVRLTLVDYPETLYAGELPLGDFRPGDSIPGPYLGPACPVIRAIHTGVDDIGQDRAGTNPILLRIEIEPDDSSRPAARAYIVQCRQSTVVGIKPTAAEDDDPVLQGQPDDEYYEQPGTAWQDCGVIEKPGVGTLILSSGFSIGERIDIRVIALDDEGRASCWRVYESYLVELPAAAAPGGRLHFGEIDPDPEAAPDDAIGQDGDRYIADDGRTWVKVDGAWVFQGDFTGEGTKIHSGEVAEDALPPSDIGTIGDLYFAYDGRWWEKTDETTWTPRGDLTGPAGSATFTGSGEPAVELGKDGDVYVRDDGTVWRKAGGVWTNTGIDLTGKAGSKLHSGEVADGAKPPAGTGNVDDVFLASDGRWWQKTADATWTLRGDLTGPPGSATFTGSGEPMAALGKDGDVYVADDGTLWRKAGGVWTNTGIDLTGDAGSKLHSGEVAAGAKPPAGLGNVDDVYLASDGRWWQKTADATWTLRGDLTGPPGSATFTGSGDPPVALGKDGDVYVSDDGTLWRKAGGVWTNTGIDFTGDPGSKLHSGEVAAGAKPPAGLGNVDDVYLASDGRWWQKTADATWTLRGDLTGPPGSATFTGSGEPPVALGKDGDVYVRDDGTLWHKANGVWTYTGVDLTGDPGTSLIPGDVAEGQSPAASIGKVGDIFFNLDGRVWEKTDDTTWTSRGDITGPPGSSLIPGVVAEGELPPANVGNVGDTFLAADGRFWQKTDATTWTYIDDLTGPPAPGGGFNPRGNWRPGTDYAVGDSVFRQISQTITIPLPGGGNPPTFKSSRSYLCKVEHTASSSNAPSGSGNTYWDAITGDTSLDDDSTDPEVTTSTVTRYQLASSRPATPPSSTENPPAPDWDLVAQPPQHATLSIYKLVGTRTYDDDVFRSSVWAVTFVQGPGTPGPGPVITTDMFTGYRRGTSAPPTPSSDMESPELSWFIVNPGATTISGIYRLDGKRTYHDGVFHSAVWVVTLVRGPIIVTTDTFTGYRRAISTPATPSSSTESPSGWSASNPGSTVTQGVYKLEGTRTYHDDAFHSSVWVVTLVQGPMPPGPVITTNTFTGYRRGTSTPPTPSSNMESPSISWFIVNPGATTISGIYRLDGTRTYHDGVFHSAVWVVTLVRGPIIVTTDTFTGYQRAISTPATPSSSTESPSGWSASNPGSTVAQGVYKLVGTRTYHDDVFQSAVWVVTLAQGPTGP